jgi:hypothetical protein
LVGRTHPSLNCLEIPCQLLLSPPLLLHRQQLLRLPCLACRIHHRHAG